MNQSWIQVGREPCMGMEAGERKLLQNSRYDVRGTIGAIGLILMKPTPWFNGCLNSNYAMEEYILDAF